MVKWINFSISVYSHRGNTRLLVLEKQTEDKWSEDTQMSYKVTDYNQ